MNFLTGGISGIGKARDSSIIFINRIGNSCLTNLNDSSIDPVLSEYNSQFWHQSCLSSLTEKHIFCSRKRSEKSLVNLVYYGCVCFIHSWVCSLRVLGLKLTLFRISALKLTIFKNRPFKN